MAAEFDASEVVHEFVRRVNAQDQVGVSELFAEDAVFMGPDCVTRHGRQEIYKFFTRLDPEFIKPHLPMRPTAIVHGGNQCLMAFQSKLSTGEYEHTAVDQFTVNDDGKITEFIVYLRPGPAAAEYGTYHAEHAAQAEA